jgi:hypothetical protein
MGAVVGGCSGFVLGALIGAALGVGIGLGWTNLMETSCFEGYCGMLVFFTFMPIGALLGGLAGAILLARLGGRPSAGAATKSSGP